MARLSRSPSIRTHAQAVEFLAKARSESDGRPLSGNTRVVRCKVHMLDGETIDTVGVRLHETVVVAYLPDGRYVLNTGGWNTATTKDRINSFSPAHLGLGEDYDQETNKRLSDHSTLRVTTSIRYITASKVRTCRTCKGEGGKDYYSTGRWDYWSKCYRCDGTGEQDYGRKRVSHKYEDNIIVDSHGDVVGLALRVEDLASSPRDNASRYYEAYPVRPFAGYFNGSTVDYNEPVREQSVDHYRQPTRNDFITYADPSSHDGNMVELSKLTKEQDAELAAWDEMLAELAGRKRNRNEMKR